MLKLRLLSLMALLGLVASCDTPTGPNTGSIRVELLTEAGLRMEPSALPNVTLDEVRVSVAGPTTKTVTSTTPAGGFFDVVVDGLEPGTYTVTVTGLVAGEVAHLGEVTNIGVEEGKTATAAVTFPDFQPDIPNPGVTDSVDVLRFTVAYGAVAGATSYLIEWSLSPTMVGASSIEVTGLTTDINVTEEGTYFVTVRAKKTGISTPGLASAPKTVYVIQGVATVTVTPATPTIAAGATQQLTAEGRDALNVIVPSVSWYWASSNHAVATVSQTGLVTGVGGGAVTITAVGKGTPGSSAVSVTALPATKLAFSSPPGSTAAGTTIPTVRVAVQNVNGGTITTDNTTQVTIAIGIDAGPGGVLTGLATVSAVAGVATFANLSIAQAGEGYTLVVTATGVAAATSDAFNIAAGTATQLAFTIQPSATAANAAMSPAVQVTVRDALGNRVPSSGVAVTVAIGTNPSAGVLAGTTVVNAVTGVASFSGLSISNGGTGYTLTASATGLAGATSATFDIGAVLPATQVVFVIQPANSVAGDALSPAIQVEVRNASGQRVRTSGDAVTLAFAANPGGGVITGTHTVNAINGIASFSGLTINKAAAGYTLSAAAPGLTGSTSTAFSVAPGAPNKLRFLTAMPAAMKGNVAIGTPITVAITDAFDNVVTTATNAITLTVGNDPWANPVNPGATVSATPLTLSAAAGSATFSGVKVDRPGIGYTLAATATGMAAGESTPFNVNVTFDGAVTAGRWGSGAHSCAISTESGTYCWGVNSSGQLGGSLPLEVGFDSVPALVRGGYTFVSVTAGQTYTCGLSGAGAVYCWGSNQFGNLGNGTVVSSAEPVAVLGGHVYSSIDASNHICGVTTANAGDPAEDRQLYCWGNNNFGQLGTGNFVNQLVPFRVPDPLQTARVIAVSTGFRQTCAIAVGGAAYCWGQGAFGELGVADLSTTNYLVPTLVAGGNTWTSLSAGHSYTCGISSNGGNIARCWGQNTNGKLGDNSTTTRYVPTPVAGNLTTWTKLSAGQNHTCGTAAGLSMCWGGNTNGELGNDDTALSSLAPSVVAGGLTLLDLDAGFIHTCGRTASAVYCWGTNSNGRLGSAGLNEIKRSPALVIQ